ncbi:MAG: branched-chain amino acid ABC transporter substrate-binding protein [Betaproteobacteria bacterium]
MKLPVIRIIAIVFLLLQPPGAFAADTVKVAFIAPLSGTFALVFQENLKLFRAAADEVNAKGGVLGGRKIEIVPFDNKGTPQETLIVLNQAIDQDIRYVLATISSIALAISDALSKHNARHPDHPIVFLNYDAREPSLTENKCSFWHFRFEPHSDMQVGVLTDFMARQPSVKKVYLINQDYAWGHSFRRAAREMLGSKRPDIQFVGDDLVPLGKIKDFAPYVSKIRASGADTVLTGNWGNDLVLLVKASEQSGLDAQFYTTHAWVWGTPTAIGAAGAGRIRTIMAFHINDANAEWEKKILSYGQKYQPLAHMDFLPVWQTMDMFAQAIEQAQSIDPKKVASALEGMQYNGPAGESWMRAEDHQLMAPIYVTSFVKRGQPGVKFDTENTGFGWKTELLVPAKDSVPPLNCQMERP